MLDPETGMCDLYAARPMTCRVFGPPVRSEGGLGVCELCFQGATPEQIAACELHADTDQLEAKLLERLERTTGRRGNTIVAFRTGALTIQHRPYAAWSCLRPSLVCG